MGIKRGNIERNSALTFVRGKVRVMTYHIKSRRWGFTPRWRIEDPSEFEIYRMRQPMFCAGYRLYFEDVFGRRLCTLRQGLIATRHKFKFVRDKQLVAVFDA